MSCEPEQTLAPVAPTASSSPSIASAAAAAPKPGEPLVGAHVWKEVAAPQTSGAVRVHATVPLAGLDFCEYPFCFHALDGTQFKERLQGLSFSSEMDILNLSQSDIPSAHLGELFGALAKDVKKLTRFSFSIDPTRKTPVEIEPATRAEILMESLSSDAAVRLLKTVKVLDLAFINFSSHQFDTLITSLQGSDVETLYLGSSYDSAFIQDCLSVWSSSAPPPAAGTGPQTPPASKMNLPKIQKVVVVGDYTGAGSTTNGFKSFKDAIRAQNPKAEFIPLCYGSSKETEGDNAQTLKTLFDDHRILFKPVSTGLFETQEQKTRDAQKSEPARRAEEHGTRAQFIADPPPVEKTTPPANCPTHPAHALDWGHAAFSMDEIHKFLPSTKGERIKVAIIDTGIDLFHPHIYPRIVEAVSFVPGEAPFPDPQSHGTHCAGTVLSVAPDVELYIAKVFPFIPGGPVGDIPAAIDWAVSKGVKVINMSLGNAFLPDANLYRAVFDAARENVTIVSAACNYGNQFRYSIGYPAKFGVGLCVGSHDVDNAPSLSSSIGRELDFLAPGHKIVSTINGGVYGEMSGSSMAAPFVTGLVASLLSFERTAYMFPNDNDKLLRNPICIRIILRCMASKHGDHDQRAGYGAIKPKRFFAELWSVKESERAALFRRKFEMAEY